MLSWLKKFVAMDVVSKNDDLVQEDENPANGLLLLGTYFPEEVISHVLIHVPWKDLLACRLVCKSWRRLIDYPVCFDKLEKFSPVTLNSSFSPVRSSNVSNIIRKREIPMYIYYSIGKRLFIKNLIKNPSGTGNTGEGDHNDCRESPERSLPRRIYQSMASNVESSSRFKYWKITRSLGDGWIVEPDPVGSQPVPEVVGTKSCFVSSYHPCSKQQLIDLQQSGLNAKIMDEVTPDIEVSEWYARRWDCGAKYMLSVSLLDGNKDTVDNFETQITLLEDDTWRQVKHTFKEYGPGVRYVLFDHSGRDTQFWSGHYGSKMTGASVVARIPGHLFQPSDTDQATTID